jgi:hypothetical protein
MTKGRRRSAAHHSGTRILAFKTNGYGPSIKYVLCHHSRVSGGEEYQNRKHCNLVSSTAKQPQCQCAKRSTTLFSLSSRLLIITDIASTRHASIEIARWSCAVPTALPAAGLPIIRGGNALAVSAEHFFATSAVTADALFVVQATLM